MPPTGTGTCGALSFSIVLVADLDKKGSKIVGGGPKSDFRRKSILKRGNLNRADDGCFNVEWKDEKQISSGIMENGRGFELSDLKIFNGRLYTVDDRTGIVYWLKKDGDEYTAIPWVIMMHGNGEVSKGFKGEWITEKDGVMYIGSHGNEWAGRDGTIIHKYMMWTKTIEASGALKHHDWEDVYQKARAAAKIEFPGYLTHEGGNFSSITRRWNFLPRKLSSVPYEDKADETACTNRLISCNEKFEDWKVVEVGDVEPSKGFSSFKFVPGTNDEVVVAIKAMEIGDTQGTWLLVFNVDGTIIMPATHVADKKFEGIEISVDSL